MRFTLLVPGWIGVPVTRWMFLGFIQRGTPTSQMLRLLINLSMLLQISFVRITSRDFPLSFSKSRSSQERERERASEGERERERTLCVVTRMHMVFFCTFNSAAASRRPKNKPRTGKGLVACLH